MRLSRVALFSTVIAAMAVAGGSRPISGQDAQPAAKAAASAGAGCTPIETREANVPEQKPAFPGQTRVCEAKSDVAFDVVVVAPGLVKPWAIEPLPDGSLLVTEKAGRLRIVSAAGELGPAITGLPEVDARGQGGLLDVELSPAFATDRTIFWSFSEPREGGNATSVARGVLSSDRTALEARARHLPRPARLQRHASLWIPTRVWSGQDALRDARRAFRQGHATAGAAA